MIAAKKYLAILFLGVFSLALLPKEWLHHCHKAHIEHAQDNHFEKGKCETCDYRLAHFTETEPVLIPQTGPKPKKVVIIVVKPKPKPAPKDTTSSRAPPVA